MTAFPRIITAVKGVLFLFFTLIAIGIFLLLTVELFYFRYAFGKCLAYFGCNIKSKRVIIIKYLVIAAIMGLSVAIFTIPGLLALHLLLSALMTEIACLIVRLITRRSFMLVRFVSSTLIVPLILGISMVVYGYINIHSVVGTEYEIKTEKTLGRDYKTVFLSDLHAGVSLDYEELGALCSDISALGADALFLGGDIVDESTTKEQMENAFALLGSVKTTYGVFYVDGNHDIPRQRDEGEPNFTAQDLNGAIEKAGINILRDSVVNLGNDLVLIGHRDASFRGNEKISERETIENLMANVPKDKYVILLEHQPKEYERVKAAGVNLILSGHTHAGQIWPVGLVTTLLASNEQNYGIETYGDFSAIVSSGVAGWAFPIKTEKHAEYVIVNITNK